VSYHKKALFRQALRNKKLDITRELEIVEQFEAELNNGIADIVGSAISAVNSYLEIFGIKDAVEELKTHAIGDYIQIDFESGRTDFSTDSWQMLPNLLRNPKISKDGNLYKVIPVGSIKGKKLDVTKDINSGIEAMRNSKGSLEDAAQRMSAHFNMSARVAKEQRFESSRPVQFATASSKQDPSTSWVYPAKDMDVTYIVEERNYEIRMATDELVDSTIDKYLRMLEDE
jgi:hypothetical protein